MINSFGTAKVIIFRKSNNHLNVVILSLDFVIKAGVVLIIFHRVISFSYIFVHAAKVMHLFQTSIYFVRKTFCFVIHV